MFTHLPVKILFPDLEANVETLRILLSELNITEALFFAANLKLNLHNLDGWANQSPFLPQFFTQSQIKVVEAYARKVGRGKKPQLLNIFSHSQLRELMRWVCRFSHSESKGDNYSDFETRKIFLKAALIAAEIWENHTYQNWYSPTGQIQITPENMPGVLRKAIAESSLLADPIRYIGRGRIIFREHLPKFYPQFENEFETTTGLTIGDYYFCITSIILLGLQDTNHSRPSFTFQEDALFDAFPKMRYKFIQFIHLEAQAVDELTAGFWGENITSSTLPNADTYGLRFLRDRPLLRTDSGRTIILDMGFLIDKSILGLIFHLSIENRNAAFTAFGSAFEDYACDIFQQVYPSAPNLVNRVICDLRGIASRNQEVQIADTCLIGIEEIALLELKAGRVADDRLLDEDFVAYFTGRFKNRDRKVQLAVSINKILSGEWKHLEEEITPPRYVFPILLAYDPLVAAPSFPRLFSNEFQKDLQPEQILRDGTMIKGGFTVSPYITITIDVLEDLRDSLSKFSFFQLLRDYSREYFRSNLSLGDFLKLSRKYRPMIIRKGKVVSEFLAWMDQFEKLLNRR